MDTIDETVTLPDVVQDEPIARPVIAQTAFDISADDLSVIAGLIPDFGESGAVYEDGKLLVPDGPLVERVAADIANLEGIRKDRALASLRLERDRLLQGSDWTQLPDALPVAARKTWATYRQALRDMPATGDPLKPQWPIMPVKA